MQSHAIYTKGLTRRFDEKIAVADLSLTVEVGEVFGFLGHNGAGKTTTVRLLNGVLMADEGEIRVLGHDPQVEGTMVRARTGVLTETPSLDERLTTIENLKIYADLYSVSVKIINQRFENLLETFDLSKRAYDKVGAFSKGMKQRLALARAFLHEPELLFLDEPTSGLDPIATQEVHQMIHRMSRDEGRTIFLCTHNLVEAQRLCDRVAIMEHGRLVAVGTPLELVQQIGAKSRYMLEVAPDQISKAREKINQISKVNNVQSDGDRLTITVDNREVAPDILTTLVQHEIRIYSLTPQLHSLEDIYMAIHGHEDKR